MKSPLEEGRVIAVDCIVSASAPVQALNGVGVGGWQQARGIAGLPPSSALGPKGNGTLTRAAFILQGMLSELSLFSPKQKGCIM